MKPRSRLSTQIQLRAHELRPLSVSTCKKGIAASGYVPAEGCTACPGTRISSCG